MLSTNFEFAFNIFFACIAFLSAIAASLAARRADTATFYAEALQEWIKENNEKSVALKEIAEMQLTLTDHADLLHQITAGIKKLRSRAGMRELREKRSLDGSDLPDPKLNPEEWKRAMRLRLHNQGTANGK